MIVQQTFDYNALDIETRIFVLDKAATIHARLKRTAEDIIAIGQDLIEVKEKLPDMKFSAWLRAEFEMTRQTAYRFMRVTQKFGSCNIMLQLPPTALYSLLDTPDDIIDQVESGQIEPTLPAIREAKQEMQAVNLVSAPSSLDFYKEHRSIEIPEEWKLPPSMRIETPAKSPTLTALQSSESNEWYTPAEYVNAVRELMNGIDLDPASCLLANGTVQAIKYYDRDENGLDKDWRGRVWLNPPYGFTEGKSNQEIWTHRLLQQFRDGVTAEAVLLVNANTEAKWFQPLYDHLICLTHHRIRFYNSQGDSSQPTQGNALVYFGSQRRRFIELFNQFGTVIERAK